MSLYTTLPVTFVSIINILFIVCHHYITFLLSLMSPLVTVSAAPQWEYGFSSFSRLL